MQKSIKVIESEAYANCINSIENKIYLKILDKYKENMANRDSGKMDKANVSSLEIINILEEDRIEFLDFLFSKIKKYENVKFKEDYPKGESPEEEEDNEEVLGYAKGFILLYAIEFFLLKNRPTDLESYLKETRVPQAKKYAKELNVIYSGLGG